MDVITIAALLALGASTGFAAGLLGIGGGMLMVPFMTMLLSRVGMPSEYIVQVAIATSLTTIVFTSISSVRAHDARGAVRWPIVRALVPGIALGAIAGAQVAGAIPGRLLAAVFGAFIGFSAVRMFAGGTPGADRDLPGRAGMSTAGGLIGVVSALLGAGGGFITVPFLVRRKVPIQAAVATSAACGLPIAVAGTLGYLWAGWHLPLPSGTVGYVYLPALAAISAASVLTAPWGARTAHALPTATLRRVFALLLLALAAYMLWRAASG